MFTMLQLLTFLEEKVSLLFKFKLFDSSWLESRQRERAERRTPSPPLRRGDVLEVPRSIFTHFGIYLGDNKVAHLIPDILPVLTSNDKLISSVITNERLILGCIYRCAMVRVDTLEDFAYGASILVNHVDKMMKTPPLPDVAKRAEKLIGAFPYSLLWSNCEHFVTYCRYGAARSRQTEQFCEVLKSIIRDQRTVIVSGLLGIISVVYFGIAPLTTLPTILIPFTLWMAG
ncbi:lecithin retinol acyltransferase a [Pundamilia nyererei]|uniref:Lecithin retinol acyltransferase a n=2 Tax=Pundamilia nyererei TaxID=303518 RepID=A0A9Y3RSV4_9CICH|nr:PREDICTED: lecithin retinol acyltransferase [Pundamilia nyererei]